MKYYESLEGIQLLSPDSIDPARPLQNGFLAPSTEDSLGLLRAWIDECKEHHHTTCHPAETVPNPRVLPARLRAIDVRSHAIVEVNPTVSQYATLSYVWGDSTASYLDMVDSLDDSSTPRLPATVPQLVLDALAVCTAIAIPYLWVNLYCVHQANPERKSIEIALMGQIYRFSTITLVAGSPIHRALLPPPGSPAPKQLTYTIPRCNITLITQPPTIVTQIEHSPWIERSWTFQEGHLARRLAFFNPPYDPSFLCGSGLFRPTLHSGPYGHWSRPPTLPSPDRPDHPAHLPPLDLRSGGFRALGGHSWLATSEFDFVDYSRIVMGYSSRSLSFESDKLKALEGCLNAIAERKGVEFLHGLPTAGFHYALLWTDEDEGRRHGFPSWSWAGWVATTGAVFLVLPRPMEKSGLVKGGDGVWGCEGGVEEPMVGGLVLSQGRFDGAIIGGPSPCRRRLAALTLRPPGYEAVKVGSEGVRVWVELNKGVSRPVQGTKCRAVCCEVLRNGGVDALEDDRMYEPSHSHRCGVYLRDRAGNLYKSDAMGLEDLSSLAVRLPYTLSGKELRWLMEDGLDLIRIVDLELYDTRQGSKPYRQVLCLGVDRSWDPKGGGGERT